MKTNRRGFFGLLAGVVGSSIYTVNAKEPQPITIPTDEAKYQRMLQLHDKQVISTKTLLENFGYDYNHELESLRYEEAAKEFVNDLPKYCTERYEDRGLTITKYMLPNNVAPAFKRNILSVDYHIAKYRIGYYSRVEGQESLVPTYKFQILSHGIYEGNYFFANYRRNQKMETSLEEVIQAILNKEESMHREHRHVTVVSCQSFPDEVEYLHSISPLELVENFSEVM